MIRKKTTPQGYVEYEMQHKELSAKLFAGNRCDNCNCVIQQNDTVHLIPVLNGLTYCQNCFDEWIERAIYFEEDIPFEQGLVRNLDKLFNIEKEPRK